MADHEVQLSAMGEGAVLLVHQEPPNLRVQRRLWAAAQRLRESADITDAVCGMGNLLALFDPLRCAWDEAAQAVFQAWREAKPARRKGRVHEVPVHYGGAHGPDLAAVAAFANLTPTETAELHASAEYIVFAMGSSPGFGYLGGIPPRIAIPRRPVPLLRAEQGSVIIGGPQTGVTSAAGPTGWHVLGSTERPLFDQTQQPPAVLAPGDGVRFRIAGIEP